MLSVGAREIQIPTHRDIRLDASESSSDNDNIDQHLRDQAQAVVSTRLERINNDEC
jgi:hypothetical protein